MGTGGAQIHKINKIIESLISDLNLGLNAYYGEVSQKTAPQIVCISANEYSIKYGDKTFLISVKEK